MRSEDSFGLLPINSDYFFDAAIYDVWSITLDELHLMEIFFQRRDSFAPALRTSMASQIAARIGEKLKVRVAGWPQTERFLEGVYDQCRSAGRLRVQLPVG